MADYYIRETPDGADVLNRISVNVSALICTCYEVSTAHQIVNSLKALQAPPAQPLVERYGDGVLVHWPEGVEQYVQVGDCVTGYLARPTQPVAVPADGWKEATIAWEVCASIHRKYAKGRDALFSTRQHDFVAGAEKARAMLAAAERKEEP